MGPSNSIRFNPFSGKKTAKKSQSSRKLVKKDQDQKQLDKNGIVVYQKNQKSKVLSIFRFKKKKKKKSTHFNYFKDLVEEDFRRSGAGIKVSKLFLLRFVLPATVVLFVISILAFFFYDSDTTLDTNITESRSSILGETVKLEERSFDHSVSAEGTLIIPIKDKTAELANFTLPDFVRFTSNQLIVTPTSDNIGKYEVSIKTGKYLDTYNITIVEADSEFSELKDKISDLLGQEVSKYAISVYDITDDRSFGVNPDSIFPPADLSKLPIAVLALLDVEKGSFNLDTKVKGYTVSYYIYDMVVNNDNNSMTTLENFITGDWNQWESIDFRIKDELGVDPFYRYPHEVTAQNATKLMTDIYAGAVLNEYHSSYLLELIKDSAPRFQDRIVAGVPSNIEVSHVSGQDYLPDGSSVYNDLGLVYGEKTNFVLAILVDGVDRLEAQQNIVSITEMVYEFFENDIDKALDELK